MGVICLKNLMTLTREMYGRGEIDRRRYFHAYVTIQGFKPDIYDVVYMGCPLENCKKKVQPPTKKQKLYYCEKCDKYYPDFQFRYKLKVFLSDGSRRPFMVTMFDNTAKPFLGISAPDLVDVYYDDENKYDSLFAEKSHQTCYFKLRVALVYYGDGNRYPRLNGIVYDFNFNFRQ